MKNIIIGLTLILGISTTAVAQKNENKDLKTESIVVEGVCNACKKRIEEAAYIPGVKLAEWNKATNLLTVTYKPSKTNTTKISEAIAQRGHHAGELKADRATYEKLPACCAYESTHKH